MPAETPFPAAERSRGLLILAQRFSQITTRKCSSWGWKSCDGRRAARAHQAQQGCAGRAGWDRLRLGADGAAWKSSCRPHRSTGAIPQVPSPKKQPLRALVLASRPQTASRLGNGERLLQEPAPEPRGTKGAHPGRGCGKPQGQEGIWRLQIPLGRSQGAQPGLQPLGVLTAGVQQGGREGRRSFLVSGKPSRKRSRRGGGAAGAPQSCLFTGEKNQCSKYQVGPHPPRRASHNKSHPWAELLSMTRSR